MRLQVAWFIYLVFCSSIVFGKNKNVRNMILSYVTSEGRPSHVLTPNLCWENSEQIALSKSLNTVNLNAARSLQRNRTMYQTVNTLVLVDMTCEGSRDLLLAANKLSMFKSPFRWLLLDFNPSHDDVLDLLDILVDSNVVTAKAVGDQEYSFTEVYKVAPNQEVISTACCSWKPQIQSSALVPTTSIRNSNAIVKRTFTSKFGTVEDYRHTRMLSPRRLNLRRHVLTMVNVITDSNDTRRHMGDRLKLHQDSITKMSYMVVSICFDMLNATENLIFTHTWGYKDKSGNWQGIIDHLLKKEADLGTLTIFTQERMEVIDYIAMVGSTAVRFVFREPPLAYLSNIFTLPFTGAVWLAIFVCVMSCAVFLFIASKWEATMGMHPFQLDGSWADVLILIIGAVLQQGCTLEPRHAAGRCVTLLLFVALTILYAAYSANIVVLLRAPSSSVRTLSDVLNSPLKIGASDFEYNRYFFKKLNEPIRKEIYDKKIAPKGKKPNFYTMEEGVERIRKGLFAFHMELNPGYRLIQETYQEDEKCDLVEVDYINEIDPWVPGQKNSPFKDLFRMNFIKIRESGIQAAVHQRLQVPRPRCSGSVNTFSSVGIADMYPAMLATLYGMLLAPAVLLLEILYHRVLLMGGWCNDKVHVPAMLATLYGMLLAPAAVLLIMYHRLTARQKRQKRESTHFN